MTPTLRFATPPLLRLAAVVTLAGCLITEDEARSWSEEYCYNGICEGDSGWPGDGGGSDDTGSFPMWNAAEGTPSPAPTSADCDVYAASQGPILMSTSDESAGGCNWVELEVPGRMNLTDAN
jgi:hypothetical protein